MNINVLKQLNGKRAKGFFFFASLSLFLFACPSIKSQLLQSALAQRVPGGHSARRWLYLADYVVTRAIRTRARTGRGCPARSCREIHYDIMSFPRRAARSDRAFVASLRDRDPGFPAASPPPASAFGRLMSAAATRGIKVHSYLEMVIPRQIVTPSRGCVDLMDRFDGFFSFFSLFG